MNRISLFCALLVLMLLSGCGAAPKTAPDPEAFRKAEEASPVPEDAENRAGDPLPPEGAIESYTLDRAVTVAAGRELTLRLHCRRVSRGYAWNYGVGSMDVLEGDDLLQTISVGDGIRAAEAAEGLEDLGGDGWTNCFENAYLPEVMDLNFDGAGDIRLMEFLGSVNGRYLHWLWDPKTEQFVYAFCLVGYDFRIDADARQLVTEARDGGGSYYTNYYQYSEEGPLLHIKEIHMSCEEAGAIYEVHELIGGQWMQTQ